MDWFKQEILIITAITGITQGIFLSSALLITRRGERLVNRLLVCLILLFSMDILFSMFSAAFFSGIEYCIRFLYGPVVFFFMRTLRYHSFYFRKKEGIHLLPFWLSFISIIPVFLLTHGSIMIDFAQYTGIHLKILTDIMKVLLPLAGFIHLGSYLFYCCMKMMGKGRNGIILNQKDFSIHRILLFTCCIYNLLCLLSSAGRVLVLNSGVFTWLPLLFITFIFYLFVYICILKPGIIFIAWDIENRNSVYKKIRLSEQNSKEYLKRLLSVMEKEKLYTDPDLTLPLLADRVHISRNLLSYLLNSVLGINFYDFINGFRIEAVKNLLTNNSRENESILNIAFHAGFNSKSAFNKIFKKHTNMSPSQYKKISFNKTKETKIFSHVMELNLIESLENGYAIKSVCSGLPEQGTS